jgi:hypothetical protein
VAPDELRADIASAAAQMKNKYGTKREMKVIEQYLDPAETVVRIAGGRRSGQAGLIVLTDRRYMFLWQGLVRSSHESIPLDLITGVSLKKGLMYSNIKTQGAQSMEAIEQVDKSDAEHLVNELRSRLNQRSHGVMSATPAPSIAVDDPMAKLKQLKELLDIGALSQAEFDAKKAELVARM